MIRLPIYLDYMATTPVDARVVEKMLTCLTMEGDFGNPASLQHAYGQAANQRVQWAREVIANVIKGDPNGIIFTSGATESINLAIKGCAYFYQRQRKHIITTQIEHKAVLDTCHYLSRKGFSVTYLPVSNTGILNIDLLKNAIREDTLLVSIGHVNNEIGTIQNIAPIGEYLRGKGVLFHVDGAQSIGKTPLHVEKMKIDLLSLSAHKAYGPKGIGVLYVRQKPRIHLEPLIHGGQQENGARSGTLPVHQIVGMAEAFRIAEAGFSEENVHLWRLNHQLSQGLKKIPGVRFNGDLLSRIPHVLNLNFYHVKEPNGKRLKEKLKNEIFNYLCISNASACLSANQSSHVLKAIGLSDEEAANSFRISLGRLSTQAEVEYAANYFNNFFKQTGDTAETP